MNTNEADCLYFMMTMMIKYQLNQGHIAKDDKSFAQYILKEIKAAHQAKKVSNAVKKCILTRLNPASHINFLQRWDNYLAHAQLHQTNQARKSLSHVEKLKSICECLAEDGLTTCFSTGDQIEIEDENIAKLNRNGGFFVPTSTIKRQKDGVIEGIKSVYYYAATSESLLHIVETIQKTGFGVYLGDHRYKLNQLAIMDLV